MSVCFDPALSFYPYGSHDLFNSGWLSSTAFFQVIDVTDTSSLQQGNNKTILWPTEMDTERSGDLPAENACVAPPPVESLFREVCSVEGAS